MEKVKDAPLGVVLMNLGTPAAPSAPEVRNFLAEFLTDKRVVELPRLLWLPILYGIVLPFRAPRVAKLYEEIWTDQGSPLKAITLQQVEALARHFPEESVIVTHAMTYGEPKLSDQIKWLEQQGCHKTLVLPLYPQYSATTTGAIYDQYADLIVKQRNVSDVQVHKSYCQRQDYIDALVDSIERYWENNEKGQRLLFSFHGIPKRCVELGDPYEQQCRDTAERVAGKLQLGAESWAVSFQSRLGKAEWLQPYTDKLLQEWGGQGLQSVDVICPAFSADCLETLEEIRGENRELFLSVGGQRFEFIPCLNSNPKHIEMMANIVREYCV